MSGEGLGVLTQEESLAALGIAPSVAEPLVADLGAMSYAGNASKLLAVNGAATGWEFVAPGTVADDSITNAKLANMAQATLKGRAAGAGTGDPTDLSASQVKTLLAITAAEVGSGAALTKTDDTNVTLTLGGSHASALLAAASLTLGWTGQLAVARGGTGSGTAAGAATNLGLGTGDSPQFAAVNIGHASDTTISRASAGDIAIEGNIVYRAGGTDVAVADGGTGASTAAAARTNLGLDSMATQAAGAVAITGGTITGTTSLNISGGITTSGAIVGLTGGTMVFLGSSTPSGVSGLRIEDTDASHTCRIVIGSDLTTNRRLTITPGDADRTLNISAADVTISAFAATFLDDADASAVRTTLGLTSAATTAIGTSGATIPLLSTANRWSLIQTFEGRVRVEAVGTVDCLIEAIDYGAPATGTTSGGGFRGGINSPPTAADQRIGTIAFSAVDSAVISQSSGQISARSSENWGTLAGEGTYIEIEGTANGAFSRSIIARFSVDTGLTLAQDLAVTEGGTGASTAAGAATNLGLGTGSSPQFTAVNIGHATDTTVSRASAGDIAVEGNIVYRAGGTDVAVADGGTGAGTAAAAATNLGLGTGDSPQFAAVNIGHASDTTISRVSAGDIAVEGNTIYRAGGGDVSVADGGTGRSTSTTAYGLIAAGTTATGAHQTLPAGATTDILVGGGASALPAWTAATGTGAPVRAGAPTLTGTVTSTGKFLAFDGGATGRISMEVGDATHQGYISFRNESGVEVAYAGWEAASGKLELNSSIGWEITGAAVFNSSALSVHATAGIGYATGAGGTVTQLTSKATGVTLNKICGTITMHNAALAANTSVAFTLTNSAIAANDVVLVTIKSGATSNAYLTQVQATAAGSCSIQLRNISAGSLSEAVVLNFAVIKAVAS